MLMGSRVPTRWAEVDVPEVRKLFDVRPEMEYAKVLSD